MTHATSQRSTFLLVSAISLIAFLAGCSSAKPASPTPAGTASGAATSVASTYRRDANAALEALASASTNVAEVMAKAEPTSSSWRSTLNARLDALAQVDVTARALKPAASEAELQQRLLEVTGDFNRAAQLIRSSIEPVNADNLDQAAQILTAGVTKIATLRTLLPAA